MLCTFESWALNALTLLQNNVFSCSISLMLFSIFPDNRENIPDEQIKF